ncbi:hypothetical protein ACQKND_05490 [Viridibacillus arvi]|uniref:hypothetical protein n=1 Tax=Viridibacillus arvi TaxID=263475 RepID=UPI003D045921
METGSYKMSVNNLKKELDMQIVGNFTPEQADRFIKDYNRTVASINCSDYILRLDCKDLAVVTPELVPALEDCYNLYKQSEFNKVIFEINNSVVVKMQLSRITRKVGLNKAEFVQG